MAKYVVTVKYPRRPDHDPRNKVTAPCPVSARCTDSTGQHHSFLLETDDLDAALMGYDHVTRVESVDG